jgi:predicted secreted hydrolase
VASAAPAASAGYAAVTAGRKLVFPADHGSHPGFRTEWWYITGWLHASGNDAPAGHPLGFQITFFRSQPDVDAANPSAFTPRQLIIVHCALSDPGRGRLWQDQRVRRAGMGLADAAVGDTDVWADDWRLRRNAAATYDASLAADGFALHLRFAPTQAPLPNGIQGFSRKGPAAGSASYYYSVPHLRVTGSIERGAAGAKAETVDGEAWLDHEWSSEYLDAEAVGWDWTGINLDDGGALMAFRIRGADGATRWAGATLRSAGGVVDTFDRDAVVFTPARTWLSPRSGIAYPVAVSVRVGGRLFALSPLMDDQENDTRLSTGAIYWEGAVIASEHGRPVGRGYLELTGYGARLRLR